MKCPSCGGKSGVVWHQRRKDESVLRKRKCRDCDFEWATVEIEKFIIEEQNEQIEMLGKHFKALTKGRIGI